MGFQNNASGRPKTGNRKQEKKWFFSNGGVFFLDLLSHRRAVSSTLRPVSPTGWKRSRRPEIYLHLAWPTPADFLNGRWVQGTALTRFPQFSALPTRSSSWFTVISSSPFLHSSHLFSYIVTSTTSWGRFVFDTQWRIPYSQSSKNQVLIQKNLKIRRFCVCPLQNTLRV